LTTLRAFFGCFSSSHFSAKFSLKCCYLLENEEKCFKSEKMIFPNFFSKIFILKRLNGKISTGTQPKHPKVFLNRLWAP